MIGMPGCRGGVYPLLAIIAIQLGQITLTVFSFYLVGANLVFALVRRVDKHRANTDRANTDRANTDRANTRFAPTGHYLSPPFFHIYIDS